MTGIIFAYLATEDAERVVEDGKADDVNEVNDATLEGEGEKKKKKRNRKKGMQPNSEKLFSVDLSYIRSFVELLFPLCVRLFIIVVG